MKYTWNYLLFCYREINHVDKSNKTLEEITQKINTFVRDVTWPSQQCVTDTALHKKQDKLRYLFAIVPPDTLHS